MEPAIPLHELSETVYGPVFISVMLSTLFYGVLCMQIFFYYVHYPNDSLRLKVYVAVVWALDTIHEALTISGSYKYTMATLVSPQGILGAIPELIFQALAIVLISTVVQAYFVYRIYLFSRRNIIGPIIWAILSLYRIVVNTIYVVKAFESVHGIHVVQYLALQGYFYQTIAVSSLAVVAVVDVLIAIAMTILLLRERSATGFTDTAHILQRLTVLAVNTGIWTATFAVLAIVLLHAFPKAAYYGVFGTSISSIYCNMLLANLNARTYIQRRGTTVQSTSTDIAMTRISSPGSSRAEAVKQSGEVMLISRTRDTTTEVVSFADFDWPVGKAESAV